MVDISAIEIPIQNIFVYGFHARNQRHTVNKFIQD